MLDNRLGNSLGNTLCNNVGPDNHNIAEKLHLSCALLRSVKSSWIKMGQTLLRNSSTYFFISLCSGFEILLRFFSTGS